MQHKTGDPTSTAEAYNAFTKCVEDPYRCTGWRHIVAASSRQGSRDAGADLEDGAFHLLEVGDHVE